MHTLSARAVVRWVGGVGVLGLALGWGLAGCRSTTEHHQEADKTAADIITQKQKGALGYNEPFTIETPADTLRRRLLLEQNLPYGGPASLTSHDLKPIPHWPNDKVAQTPAPAPAMPAVPTTQPLRLSLIEALEIGAHSNRDFQSSKEQVFSSALSLDLERDEFRNTFSGLLKGDISTDLSGDDAFSGATGNATGGVSRKLTSGAVITSHIALDLVKLLTGDRSAAQGLLADVSISIPLLRGAGEYVVTEPLTQAERNVIYQIWTFETFKKTFAVNVASQYLNVLQQIDQIKNAEENYKALIASTRRARRLEEAGRLPAVQVDQSVQQELVSRSRWISALESYDRRLDTFKLLLGLPTDARIELDRGELDRLVEGARKVLPQPTTGPAGKAPPADAPIKLVEPNIQEGGPLEMADEKAIRLALQHRYDLRVVQGQVYDAQRRVTVAANALEAGLTLTGSGTAGEHRSLGSAGSADAELRPEKGFYSAGAQLDLPLERTAEQNAYRESWISLERATRSEQDLEDRVKSDVRDDLRTLLEARENYQIQTQAVKVAQRRVDSTALFLEAGRVEIRDVLDAQEALVSAQNALTQALVSYRVAELELQKDMGVLEINEKGLWQEYNPKEAAK